MIPFVEANFRDRFPEFRTISADMLLAVAAASRNEMDEDVFDDLGPDALMHLVAHKLALTPFGRSARLVDSENKTTYQAEFFRLRNLAKVPSVLVT